MPAITCPSCAARLDLPAHLVGAEVRCPRCRGKFVTKRRPDAAPPRARPAQLAILRPAAPAAPPSATRAPSGSPAPGVSFRVGRWVRQTFGTNAPPSQVPPQPIAPRPTPPASNSGQRKCPFCAEDIKADAVKCKQCGEMLGPDRRGSPQPAVASSARRKAALSGLVLSVAVLAVGAFLAGKGAGRPATISLADSPEWRDVGDTVQLAPGVSVRLVSAEVRRYSVWWQPQPPPDPPRFGSLSGSWERMQESIFQQAELERRATWRESKDTALVLTFRVSNSAPDRAPYSRPEDNRSALRDEQGHGFLLLNEGPGAAKVQGRSRDAILEASAGEAVDVMTFSPTNVGKGEWLLLETEINGQSVRFKMRQASVAR
jgi:hypothetical protein